MIKIDPSEIAKEISLGIQNIIPQVMYWLGYALAIIFIFGTMFAVWYVLQFNIKVEVFPLYGSGKDNVFSIGKRKKNRVKWIRRRTAWKAMYPLFNKKEIEPFDSEFIYPGKQTYAFELNDIWIPGRINISKTEETIRAEINTVPYVYRNWQSLQHKKNDIEFAQHDFWSANKALFIGLTVSVCCLIAACVTVYFCVTNANVIAGELKTLSNLWKDKDIIRGLGGG